MTTIKRITDLSKYTNVLPYASELFGVYQPLLGWKSKRLEERFNKGLRNDKAAILKKLQNQFSDQVKIEASGNKIKIDIKPSILKGGRLNQSGNSLVLEEISSQLPEFENYDSNIWKQIITQQNVENILNTTVVDLHTNFYANSKILDTTRDKVNRREIALSVFQKQLKSESSIAGVLLFLVNEESYDVLKDLFYNSLDKTEQVKTLLKTVNSDNTTEAFLNLENLDATDQDQLKDVFLSPISIVHLFRQYFFELDTFLGEPEDHVWLSPGAVVELVEENTRKNIIEKTFDTTLDIFSKTDTETTIQDEVSDAVKDENSKNINFGASVTAEYTKIEATSSFDYESSHNTARENTHKSMREQTSKISSEIRKNYKTTFRTVNEFTEFNRTKHTLTNTGTELINYELRRKMRQVGIQVQDIGTYLCWQTYIDDPGKDLGLSKLLHIAQSAELDGLKHPEEIPRLQTIKETKEITIPFIATNPEGAGKDEMYVNGKESDGNNEGGNWLTGSAPGNLETIKADHEVKNLVAPKENFELKHVEMSSQSQVVKASIVDNKLKDTDGNPGFTLFLDEVNFEGSNSIKVNLILHWSPNENANDVIDTKNKENLANFKAEEKDAYENAYLETVRDRVNAVSNITPRKRDELREEERIIIYRKLIQDLLQNKISFPDNSTRHVVAELINSIFDVDKMLYFVAPEWWRPRLHQSKQQLYETSSKSKRSSGNGLSAVMQPSFKSGFAEEMEAVIEGRKNEVSTSPSDVDPSILVSNTTGWGDIDNSDRDNYYITEDSTPAKFGSSLGWLMQLDGDNRRNAFLNAPWVKTVMPIRPGKEKAAIEWLKAVEGMNGAPPEKLKELAEKVKEKHEASLKKSEYPKEGEVSVDLDDGNKVTSTPLDRVYEHGFYPLENSFRANIGEDYEVFDQWIEVLPTDQTVPVEVKYDPKTGRQI